MELEIDQSAAGNDGKQVVLVTAPRTTELIENVRSIETDSLSEDSDPLRERALDWIWATVDELRLQTVIANDIIQTRDGGINTNDDRCSLEDAIDQRLVAGSVIYEVWILFLGQHVGAYLA